MTREYYLQHKDAFANRDWVPFDKLDTYIKNALESTNDQVDILDEDGRWYKKLTKPTHFMPARIYRINPDWEGPAKPAEPKQKFVDVKPYLDEDGNWMIKHPHNPRTRERFLHRMVIGEGCIGFVYGKEVSDRLHYYDLFNDGSPIGYRLRIPDAVRFEV